MERRGFLKGIFGGITAAGFAVRVTPEVKAEPDLTSARSGILSLTEARQRLSVTPINDAASIAVMVYATDELLRDSLSLDAWAIARREDRAWRA